MTKNSKEFELLDEDLKYSSYLVGQRLTLADLAVFGRLVGKYIIICLILPCE